MAASVYPKYVQAAISGGADTNLLGGAVKVVLVNIASYTYASTHEFLSSVPVAARVATSASLTTKTAVDGTFDADNALFTAVTGATVAAMILVVSTGVDATSRLVVYDDSPGLGFPYTPSGADVELLFDVAGIATF